MREDVPSTTTLLALEFAPVIAGLVGVALILFGDALDTQFIALVGVLATMLFLFAGVGWVFAERFVLGCGIGLLRAFVLLGLMLGAWAAADSEAGVSGLVLLVAAAAIGSAITIVSAAALWVSIRGRDGGEA